MVRVTEVYIRKRRAAWFAFKQLNPDFPLSVQSFCAGFDIANGVESSEHSVLRLPKSHEMSNLIFHRSVSDLISMVIDTVKTANAGRVSKVHLTKSYVNMICQTHGLVNDPKGNDVSKLLGYDLVIESEPDSDFGHFWIEYKRSDNGKDK